MSTYAELQKMVAGDKTPAAKVQEKGVSTQGGFTEKKTNGEVYRELSRMVQEGKPEAKRVLKRENPYLKKTLERDSAILDPEVEAKAAERVYQEYINSEEYRQKQNDRTQERLRRLAMMDLTGIPEQYRPLMDYQEEDEKEVQLRKRAEELRAQADQKKQWETWENIDALVAEADAAYETYIHSPEYAAWQLTQEKQAMDAIAQRGITQAPTGSPYGAAGQQVQPGSNANAVAEELKAKAEYYHNIQQQKKEQLQLEKDMRVLSWWSDEDQSALKQYIAIKKAQGSSMMMDPIFEGKRVDWLAVEDLKKRKGTSTVERMAESYIRAMNQEKMETVQEKALADANSGILGGTAASLKSVGANLLGSVTGIGGYLAEMTYRTGAYETLDPNNMGMMPSVYAGAVRQQAGQNIENSGFGKAGATVYQAGMSALDNLARLVAGGGAGSLALAATGSFSQAVQDYSRQGRTPVEAVTMGIINGSLEVLTEKMSLDNILTAMENPKTGMEILKAALKAGAIEVSEEELSLLGSTLAEAMVLRERSGYQQQVAMLTAMGLPEAMAREQAARGVIDEAVQTAVQSFLSGGMMSGITSVYANVQDKIQSRRDGERLQETVQEAKAALEQKHDRDQVLPDTAAPAGQKPQQPAKTAPVRATPGGTVTIREGATVTREQLEQVEKISSFTGRQIELYQAESENEEGWYDTNTGVLHIAASEKNPDARVIAHELTHSVETAPMYKELSSLVMTRIQKTGGNLEQLRQKKRDLYARNGIALENLDDIDREIVAGYVAEHLLTSEAEIMSLSTENPGIARKILNWLNDLLAKMGNANAQERTFIRKARDAYAKALEQTGAPLRDDAGKSVRQLKARKTATEEQHRKGEISDEDLDAFYDEYNREMEILGVDPMAVEDDRFRKSQKKEKADDGRDEVMLYFEEAYRNGDISKEEYDAFVKEVGEGVQFSFAGENAKTADLDALSRAMDMEKQGHDAEDIRQNTGWFRGMDKKWRFEIDDSNMKYQRRGDLGFRERVGSYDRYRKLIEKAEDFMLGKSNAWLTESEQAELTELQKTWSESFRKEGQISPSARPSDRLSDYLRHDELFEAYPQLKDARLLFDELESGTKGEYDRSSNTITLSNNLRSAPESTLIHEIQHAIQKIEGFTPGASVEYWKEQRRDIVETIAAARRNLDLWLEDIGYPEARQKSLLAASRREKTMDQHWKDMAEFKAESKYARQIAACEAELAEFQRQYDEITHGMTAYEQYENTAGEIEARDVSTRRSMDAEGRKKTPPILGGEDTVFAESKAPADDYIPGDVSESELETAIHEVAEMSPISAISDREFTTEGRTLLDDVDLFFKSMGGQVYNPRLGDINLTRRGVKDSLAHGMTPQKASAFAAIPDVLQNGKVVGFEKNWKNRGYDSATIVAPITINGEEYLMAVIVHRSNSTNRFYVHDVFTAKKEATPFMTGTQNLGEPGGATSTISIIRKILSVKNNKPQISGKKYSISDDASHDIATISQTPEITRDSLTGKAATFLKVVERKLLNHVGGALNVPYHAQRDNLKPMIEAISDEYLRTGMVSRETRDDLFQKAYDAGVVIDREFYDQYKEIKDHLRDTPVTLSTQDQADIADFRDFRKRAYGTLRIVNKGGLPVDSAYHELHEMAPELFPAHITHPADQLQRMFEVGQSIAVSKVSLDAYYGNHVEEYKRWERVDFDEAIDKCLADLQKVQRYANDRAEGDAEKQLTKTEITVEEAEQLWKDLKTFRKEYQKISAKTLLTTHDEMQVGRLLRGEITLEYLANEENFDGIEAVYRAKAEYEKVNKQLKRYKAQIRAARLADADRLLETANTWIDKKTGIAYSRETMRRNVLDIVKDKALAQEILQEYFEPVQISQASATRFKNLYRDRVRELKLSDKVENGNKVSEAYAVQLLGEAMDNMEMISKSRGRIKTRDGMDLEEWQGMLDELWAENPKLDAEKIQNAVKEFRKIYDELFQEMNRVRLENGYEPVNYRKGYFPHFQSENGDSIIDYFGKTFGINTSVDALPTTINGMTHTFKPGIQWFGHAQERKGFQTTYDALQGFDKYIEGVANVIYQTENIQKLRAFATQARYRTSDEGLRAQVDRVNANPELTEEEKMAQIKDIFENGRYSLSNFVVELDEYTNILAGKKSKYDRTMESLMGRRAYTVMKNIESKVGANMIAGNLGSALTNFIPLTQAAARISPKYMLKGVKDAAKAVIGKDGFVAGMSDFLTNRRGTDALVKGWQEKLSGVLGTPMELIDNLVSESIVRAAYYQNQARGLSDSEAMHQADIFAAGVMADRSKGALPTVFESSNPIFKAFTQFQVEVNNQYSEVFKDIPREYADRAKWVLAACFFKYFIGAFLWNKLEEELRGRASAMDPIGIAENFIHDWRTVGFGDSVANLTVNVLEELPFTSALALLGMDIDAGRIPVSSAMPDIPGVWDALTDKDMAGEKRYKTLTEELQKPITYLLMPAGGNQTAKTWKGLKAFFEGGSYGVDGDGQEILQYPVYKDFWEMARATVFGKSATKGGREWAEDGFDSFNAKQTALYKDLKEAGADEQEAYRLIDEIRAVKKGAEPDATKVQKDAKLKLIRESSLSEECKDVVYYGLVANEAERELMDTLSDAGVEKGLYKFTADFMDAKKLDGAARKDALRDVIQGAPLTEAEKQIAVAEILGDKEVGESGKLTAYGKFVYAKQYGLTADEFMDMYANGTDIDDYLELREGNVAADSAKELATALGALELSNLSSTEKWNRQCDTILNSGVSEEEKVTALVNVSYESTGRMIQIGYDNGISPELCVALKKILPSYDANSNGNYSQAEVQNAIDAISGSEVYLAATGGKAKLTNEQKAMLWQLSNKSWKYWKNPYDKDVGQRISELMAAYGEKQPELADTFAEEVQKQILGK